MTKLNDLLTSLADCEAEAIMYRGDVRTGEQNPFRREAIGDLCAEAYQAGHAACFAKLGPALELAVEWLEYYVHDVLKTDDRIAQLKILAILSGKKAE